MVNLGLEPEQALSAFPFMALILALNRALRRSGGGDELCDVNAYLFWGAGVAEWSGHRDVDIAQKMAQSG